MVERLCMQRSDILDQVLCMIHLMPFTRMYPTSKFDQYKLNFGGSYPNLLIFTAKSVMKILKTIPLSWVESFAPYQDPTGKTLTAHLLRQPAFVNNFFELGTEEIRDVPMQVDMSSLRQITSKCPLSMLYCSHDQWAPYERIEDIPYNPNISIQYFPNLIHAFVGCNDMVPPVVEWCLRRIQDARQGQGLGHGQDQIRRSVPPRRSRL